MTAFDNTSPFLVQSKFQKLNQQYRGRFAPSPSGPLHFGSLYAALGSFLQAKSQDGLWFVRIEDIDKPREQTGAKNLILDALEAFGMKWDMDKETKDLLKPQDRQCLAQTNRLERYQQVLQWLIDNNQIYACECTRKQIKQAGNLYQGTCRNKKLPFLNQGLRLKQDKTLSEFTDGIFGHLQVDKCFCQEDYIIRRRDGLFAYQLVVVIDDIDQGITEVVRGADILDLTPRQIGLFQAFGLQAPSFVHLPLMVNTPGFKLSKQNHAKAIDIDEPRPELVEALRRLGLPVFEDLLSGTVEEIISWAIANWQLNQVPKLQEMVV